MYEQPKTAPGTRRHPPARAHNSSLHDRLPDGPGAAAGSQLTGHLAALHAATAAVRRRTADPARRAELDAALEQIAARISALSPTAAVLRSEADRDSGRSPAELHDHAHALAGRLLVVAAARQDTATAMLACRRMDAHAAALSLLGS
ncbi:SCO4983 family protein [Streptacidiphilus cavernicola]|uniref:HPt domain-containing protein n=1 Tax=Streptacidiphilus cavernicola TaxID=3342716 RepID=A0ABV6VUR9_9ACTN